MINLVNELFQPLNCSTFLYLRQLVTVSVRCLLFKRKTLCITYKILVYFYLVHFLWAWCFRTYRGQVRLVTSTFPLRSLLQPMSSTAMEHLSTSPLTKYLKDLLWVCLLLVLEFTCDYTGKLFLICDGELL